MEGEIGGVAAEQVFFVHADGGEVGFGHRAAFGVGEEEDLAGTNPRVEKVRAHAAAEGSEMVKVVARLEAEIAELDEPDRTEMLKSEEYSSQSDIYTFGILM